MTVDVGADFVSDPLLLEVDVEVIVVVMVVVDGGVVWEDEDKIHVEMSEDVYRCENGDM